MQKRRSVGRQTVYDDAFRIVEHECNDALIHFVNQMFGEHFSAQATVERLRNEQFSLNEGEMPKKRITDSHFKITDGTVSKNYHLECESGGYSEYILFRMFQYGASHGIRSGKEDSFKIIIPHSGLLVLRDDGNPPDCMNFEICTPGGDIKYEAPVIKMSSYTLDDIFKKKMYFLIPFYFFNLEKRFKEYNENEDELKEFENTFLKIIKRVRSVKDSNLSDRSKRVIIMQPDFRS